MKMLFQKQVQFTRYIKTNAGLKEFNFLKINNTISPTFAIDVSDERGRRHEFFVINEGDDWKMQGKDLPHWIVEAELNLLDAIKSEEN